jgi:outer membrane murein-binding lipoprotein Lpp
MQEIQERQDHVQHAQADIALREERIRLLSEQIQADKDELADIGKQARDATQAIWDGPGTELDNEYAQKLNDLQKAIADRAKSLKLDYQPDNTYNSPEVWANAYRLALYGVTGVDSAKELQWLDDQMKQWRDFLKTLDDRKEQLREKAAQITVAPATKISDLNAKIEELQSRVDTTVSEEDPIKSELQQAQTDLAQAQASDDGLDDKYYKELNALPGENINKHIPLLPNGRFSWVEEENSFAEGENEHHYWIFARATRTDGRQYWALGQFTIAKDHKVDLLIEPDSFISTKAILRPNLSPEEQAQ